MAAPALAAVIVAYNSRPELPDTLAALGSQLRRGDELVVVDNASADGSADVARAAGARVVGLAANAGFAAACHAGARATSAPLLFFCNPDAVAAPGALDALRGAADAEPRWGAWQALVTLPGGREVNTSGGIVHWLGMGWAGGYGRPVAGVPARRREVPFASGAALVVRRAAWDALGGFEPAYFMYGEDLDLSLRLRLAGWRVGVVPDARIEHAYEFHKGAYKWFLLERNRWWTVLGAYPGALLALLAPALVASELAFVAVAAHGGWLRAKLDAQAAVLRSLPWALRRRRRIQHSRAISVRAFADALTGELDSPFLGRAAEAAALRALQSGYWRRARRALGSAGG